MTGVSVSTDHVTGVVEPDAVFRFAGELVGLLDAAGHDATQDLHAAWGSEPYGELDVIDTYADDAAFRQVLIDGIRDDTFRGGQEIAERLFAEPHPAADAYYTPDSGRVEEPVLDEALFRPMFEATTTGTKELYTDVDGAFVDVRPTVPDDRPYQERFDTAMRWCQAFTHNYATIARETPINVPAITLLVSDEPGTERPWPYAISHRIHGPHLQDFFEQPDSVPQDYDDVTVTYKEFNDAGRDLAADHQVSYLSDITQEDFVVADDGLYFVDAGGYGHSTDAQLADDPLIADDFQERRDPGYWTDTEDF